MSTNVNPNLNDGPAPLLPFTPTKRPTVRVTADMLVATPFGPRVVRDLPAPGCTFDVCSISRHRLEPTREHADADALFDQVADIDVRVEYVNGTQGDPELTGRLQVVKAVPQYDEKGNEVIENGEPVLMFFENEIIDTASEEEKFRLGEEIADDWADARRDAKSDREYEKGERQYEEMRDRELAEGRNA